MREIKAERVTADGFAPFGQVISAGVVEGKPANQGTALRSDFCAALVSARADARPNLAVFRSVAKQLPFEVRLLERHPCSTQAFLPMVCVRFLVIVAPALGDGGPDTEGVRAFVFGPGQGMNYNMGVWHHPIVALEGEAEFAMLAWEDGSALDCEERSLGEGIRII